MRQHLEARARDSDLMKPRAGSTAERAALRSRGTVRAKDRRNPIARRMVNPAARRSIGFAVGPVRDDTQADRRVVASPVLGAMLRVDRRALRGASHRPGNRMGHTRHRVRMRAATMPATRGHVTRETVHRIGPAATTVRRTTGARTSTSTTTSRAPRCRAIRRNANARCCCGRSRRRR
jgi:hypothetical protein